MQLPAAESVPTPAYRNGDFSAAITAAGNKSLGTDPLGRPILANMIYDPNTRSVAPNGQIVTNPFPNNVIPASLFDPVSLKIQSLLPQPVCVAGPPATLTAYSTISKIQNRTAGIARFPPSSWTSYSDPKTNSLSIGAGH